MSKLQITVKDEKDGVKALRGKRRTLLKEGGVENEVLDSDAKTEEKSLIVETSWKKSKEKSPTKVAAE